MNRWKLIHSYTTVVEHGLAEPIVCPDDGQVLVSMIDVINTDNEDPVMWCPACSSRYHLGTNTWDQIEAVVNNSWNPRW